MDEEKKSGDKGFVIKDRRFVDESGDERTDETTASEEKQPQGGPDPETATSGARSASDEANAAPFPEINFASFIFSLSTTAMFHFGDFPDPVTNEAKRNLPAAKQTIDILSILKEKTEGNLDQDEKEFLEGVLYELRMRYVKEMAAK